MLTSSTAPLSAEVIGKALRKFQLDPDAAQISAIQRYIAMLVAWNEKINLTAIRDPVEILHRHFCESMFAAAVVRLEAGRLADVGSGGGFPGLPLKIARRELQVTLIESNVKKATFLAEVVRELGFSDTRVLVSRYEELGDEIAPVDFVCTRALGEFGKLLRWADSERIAAGKVILWVGGRDMEEVKQLRGWEWRDSIVIPGSLQRFLLVGTRKVASESVPRGTF